MNSSYCIIYLTKMFDPKKLSKMKKILKLKMGVNRYLTIHKNISKSISTIQLFTELLWISFQKNWKSGSIVAFDESIYEYRPYGKIKKTYEVIEPIPVVYIP